MATGTAATSARKYHHDLVHYVSCPIVYTTLSYTIGKLPAGAAILDAGIVVTTAFAGGTPQTADMGVGADTDGLATAIVLTTAGNIKADVTTASDDLYLAADTDVNVTLSAGATPSAGAGFAWVTYIIADRTP